MGRSGILCAGAWCVDRNLQVGHWPQEETVSTIQAVTDFGGCPGHNMSSALKRLGAPFPVSAQGLVGEDEFGHLLFRICDELGIERAALEMRSGVATSFTYAITAKDTGKRTFFHQPGALAVQQPQDFDFTRSTARIVHLGLCGLMPKLDGPWQDEVSGWVAVLKKARAAGLKPNMEMVSVEPERVRAAGLPMLGHLDTLIINDYEAGALAEIPTLNGTMTDAAACRAAAEKLMAISSLSMIAIHFPAGGVALARDGTVAEHPSVNVPRSEIIGSNGAGDCFAAGMLFGHHEGWPLLQSLKLAHASAAMSLRSPSTTAAVAPWQECLETAGRWGWR
ncbi:MAG: carbohydrate kinase family protein [Alphaproteobacteria bacterium]|nr:carbohydrate kinase family protein [Alphaproteobacteria bacterium]